METKINEQDLKLLDMASKGDLKGVVNALKSGGNKNALDDNFRSLLQNAVIGGDATLVRSILDNMKPNLEHADAQGVTAIRLAAETGNMEIFRILRDAGAKGETKAFDGKNAYDIANDKGLTLPKPKIGIEALQELVMARF